MKKVGNRNSISRKLIFSIAFMLTISFTSFAQEADASATSGSADPVKGKELFNANCAACHKLDAKATGPALRGVAGKYDASWLHKWVRNSSDLIKSGDAQAVKVFEENNKVVMSAFPQLSDGDIDNIIAYTSEPKAEAAAPAAGKEAVPGTAASDSGVSNNIILGALALVMIVLVVMLFLVLHQLGYTKRG